MASMAGMSTAPDDWRDDDDDWSEPPARRRALTLTRLACALLGAVLIAAFVAMRHVDTSHNGSSPAAADAIKAPEWVESPSAANPFVLQSAVFEGQSPNYQSRRRGNGEGREDILAFGALDGKHAYLQLVVGHDAGPADPTLFVELARRAAETRLAILHADQPFLLPARFGIFEAARMSVAGPPGEVPCLGFRMSSADDHVRISGLACGPAKPFEKAELACLIDGLALAGPTTDASLGDFFRAADQAHDDACPVSRLISAKPEPDPFNPPTKANIRIRAGKKRHGAV